MLTIDEAKAIAKVVSTAHANCLDCAIDLATKMQLAFPNLDWQSLVENSGTVLVEDTQDNDD